MLKLRPVHDGPIGDGVGPVLVVGAGPVGLSAALALHGRGVCVRIIEAECADRVRPGSRAVFVHNEPLAALDSFHPGIAGSILEHGMLWHRRRYTYRGRVIYLRDYKPRPGRPPRYGTSQSQRVTEGVLMAAVVAAGIPIEWDTEVTSVEATPTGVTLTARGGRRLAAPYVVAADGARSTVRKSLGIAMEGRSSETPFIVADVGNLPDHPLPLELTFHYEHPALAGRNLLLLPMKDAWRVDLQCLQGDDAEHLASPAGVCEWLPKVLPAAYAHAIQWVSTYRFHQLVAASMVDPSCRVLLIGEAAHLFAPWGGRGLNSGILDASSAAIAIANALAASSASAARQAIGWFAEDRREAALFNRKCAAYGLELLAPETFGAKVRRRIAGLMAPYWSPAAMWLSTGPNGGDGRGRPGKSTF
jgi:3-(3-hydroxy-phenyl)propionate hydroxylase